MPFRSEAQKKFLYANHPEIAKEFEAETHGKLPARASKPKPMRKAMRSMPKSPFP